MYKLDITLTSPTSSMVIEQSWGVLAGCACVKNGQVTTFFEYEAFLVSVLNKFAFIHKRAFWNKRGLLKNKTEMQHKWMMVWCALEEDSIKPMLLVMLWE